MTGIIYMYTSPSGKSYIGQTFNEKQRKYHHKRAKSHCKAFNDAINRYGFDNFKYCVLHSGVETKEELDRLECLEILNRNTMVPSGYNLKSGGSRGLASEETKRRQSESRKGKLTQDHIAKMVAGVKARVWTEDERRAMGDRKRGKPLSDKHKKAVSDSLRGRVLSSEHRKKLSNSRQSDRSIKQFKEASVKRFRPVVCVETGIKYESCAEAERHLGIQSVNQCARGKYKTAGGFHWEYI